MLDCWYNYHLWVGLILSVNESQLEVNVKVMCPSHVLSPSLCKYCIFRLKSQFSGPNFLTEFSGIGLFGEYTLNQTILEIKMSLGSNSQLFPLFCTLSYLFALCLFCPTYLHFAYFALCMISIVFARAIKTDKICVFCFKLPQNIVTPGAGLIWRHAHQIFCFGLLGGNMVKPSF